LEEIGILEINVLGEVELVPVGISETDGSKEIEGEVDGDKEKLGK